MNISYSTEEVHPEDSTEIMHTAYKFEDLVQPTTLQFKISS